MWHIWVFAVLSCVLYVVYEYIVKPFQRYLQLYTPGYQAPQILEDVELCKYPEQEELPPLPRAWYPMRLASEVCIYKYVCVGSVSSLRLSVSPSPSPFPSLPLPSLPLCLSLSLSPSPSLPRPLPLTLSPSHPLPPASPSPHIIIQITSSKPVDFILGHSQSWVMYRGAHSGNVFVVKRFPAQIDGDLADATIDGDRLVLGDTIIDGAQGEITFSDGTHTVTAMIERLRVTEVNQMIYIFWHPDGYEYEPAWLPLVIPTLNGTDLPPGEEQYELVGSHHGYVHCHPQDVAENGADFAHFVAVHEPFFFDLPFTSHITHKWSATWDVREAKLNQGHIADMHVRQHMMFNKKIRVPGSDAYSHVIQDGLGTSILLIENAPIVGKLVIIQGICPEGLRQQVSVHHAFAPKGTLKLLAQVALMSMVSQFEKDIPIWSNKAYLRKPMPVRGDGPLMKYRRYAKQFYV
jgi:3-Ketosteroid 9alpha-hydroxylase C-terminal domain